MVNEMIVFWRQRSGCHTMDELSGLLQKPIKRRGRPPKRMSDEGLGSSMDSHNDSIAHSVKRRKRGSNPKQFDTKYFLDSMVDRIENKYKHTKEDPIIDINSLEIINERDIGFVEKSVRKDFGYFAENTLEDLRQNSFRDKRLMSCPSVASTPTSSMANNRSKRQNPNPNTHKQKYSDSKALRVRTFGGLSRCPKPSNTQIAIASDDSDNDSESISNKSNESIEIEDSHPLVVYENRNSWTDKEYQISCLKHCIEMLKTDKTRHFRDALKGRALQTLNLGGLPSGPTINPIIRFNLKGEPNFEFHFLAPNSPLDARESLQIDSEIFFMSKTIYDTICLKDMPQKTSKRISYSTKRRIDFDYY